MRKEDKWEPGGAKVIGRVSINYYARLYMAQIWTIAVAIRSCKCAGSATSPAAFPVWRRSAWAGMSNFSV